MRTIKFRGQRIKFKNNGELVYGYFSMNGRTALIWYDEGRAGAIVDPDSVAQLVGYDKDGNEVYEGDKVTSEVYEGEYVARLTGNLPPHPILQEATT